MNSTLQQIRNDLRTIAERLDAYESKSVSIPGRMITGFDLHPGERHIGTILGDDGQGHHIIRLPYDRDKRLTWQEAMEYAAQEGAELPDRVESALLYAKCEADEYAAEYHWTREQHDGDESYAWLQNFGYGNQGSYRKNSKYRVVLVRRVAI